MIRCLLIPVLLLLLPGPAAAQGPVPTTSEPAAFWPTTAYGIYNFSGPTAHPSASAFQQAKFVRAWLKQTCGPAWSELSTVADSSQWYQGQLRGVRPGVVLAFFLSLKQEPTGWQYTLSVALVSSPATVGTGPWQAFSTVLFNVDFLPDMRSFQRQLQRALPNL